MKTFMGLVVVCLLAGAGLFAWTLTPAVLDTPRGAPELAAPNPRPPTAMRLSILEAGYMESLQAFSYRGGDFKPYISGMAAALIQHPDGDILIDTGFGRDVDTHYKTIPKLMQWLASYTKETPAAEQLRANHYDFGRLKGIYITHAHWDHVSGLPDFAGVPTRLSQTERDFVASGDDSTRLLRSFVDRGTVELEAYQFNAGAYENFPRSHDVYGDGSVVIVPLPGHTPGSVGIFVNLPSGKRYLFAGDTVWAREGVALPAERPWLARRLVDHDAQAVRGSIVKLHELAEARPGLVIVPAHDRRIHDTIAQYPATER